MKKLIFLMLAVLLSFSLVEAAPTLSISWQLSAETLRPGSEVILSMTFTNAGQTEITNVFVTSDLGPHLRLISGVNELELGALSSTSSQQAALSFRVNEDAVSTSSFITLEVKYYTGTSSYAKTLSVPVTIRRLPILKIENVSYDTTVEPGKETILSFEIVNSGDGPAKDLKVSLNQTELFIVPSSSGEILIPNLGPSERRYLEFPIIVDPDASAGINSITVNLLYYDETKSSNYSETNKIGLKVTGEADFVVSVDSGTNFFYGSVGEAEIIISNKGTGSAEYVTVKATSDYGSKEFYIGSLDSDDSETIDLMQDLRTVTSKYPITLEISYKDKFQNSYSVVKVVEVMPVNAPTDYTMIIVIVVVAGVGYWYYRKRKKK
jgi:uncharacterized repeat protein (TIGR01451 family)